MKHEKKLYSARLDKEKYERLETYVRRLNKADYVTGKSVSTSQVIEYAIQYTLENIQHFPSSVY